MNRRKFLSVTPLALALPFISIDTAAKPASSVDEGGGVIPEDIAKELEIRVFKNEWRLKKIDNKWCRVG